MESVLKTIYENDLIKKGETIAVATSGGIDSICLLHFLNSQKKKLGIEVVAVNVDHSIRKESANDTKFVADFCSKYNIPCHKFKVDVPSLAKQNKLGTEETARMARYNIFDNVLNNGLADKIAIAHHQSDQVETILLNIFRGAGLKGASGMETKQGKYIRPLLNTSKTEIQNYAQENELEFVVDETNFDSDYSRNFLRNEIVPKLKTKWKNIENNILNFGAICKQDDEYIASTINFDDIVFEKTSARIPLYKFASQTAVQNRIFKYCFQKLNLSKDIEKRHLTLLRELAQNGKSGTKINLPNKLRASVEYDELVLEIPKAKKEQKTQALKFGKTNFENYMANIKLEENISKKQIKELLENKKNCHYIDFDKLPKDVVWRARKNGDLFVKFGSGEKKLKDYLIDLKVPNNLRDQIPMLASENTVFCVLGYEISEKVKITDDTKNMLVIKYKKI